MCAKAEGFAPKDESKLPEFNDDAGADARNERVPDIVSFLCILNLKGWELQQDSGQPERRLNSAKEFWEEIDLLTELSRKAHSRAEDEFNNLGLL